MTVTFFASEERDATGMNFQEVEADGELDKMNDIISMTQQVIKRRYVKRKKKG